MESGKCALAAAMAVKKLADVRSAIQRATIPTQRNGLCALGKSYAKILANRQHKKKALGLKMPSAFYHQNSFCHWKAGALS